MKFSTVRFFPAPGDSSPTGLPVYKLTGIPKSANLKAWKKRLEELGCCGIVDGCFGEPEGFVKLNFWASPQAIEKLQQTFPNPNSKPKQLTLF